MKDKLVKVLFLFLIKGVTFTDFIIVVYDPLPNDKFTIFVTVHLAHLAYHVHKSCRKTPISIIIIIIIITLGPVICGCN